MSLLIASSSPHTRGRLTTSHVMAWVMVCCIPGVLAQTYFFGWGNLIQIAIAMTTAITTEAVMIKLRNRPLGFFLKDNTALLTGLLLGIALPPFAPWWITVIATGFAISFAKQLYGGLGNNPFNPAMAGYALVLVSFPVQLTTNWSLPTTAMPSFLDQLSIIFASASPADGLTGATPLDVYKTQIEQSTATQLFSQPIFSGDASFVALGWDWINLMFLLGGLVLIWRKIITWHIPASMLAALLLMSFVFSSDSDTAVPFTLHLFAGATMFGAFFIATDPVSASTTKLGKIIYGAGIGILLFVIRKWGAYPDAVAFAVLLMNFAAPFIDQYTQPRTYGHEKARRGMISEKDELS